MLRKTGGSVFLSRPLSVYDVGGDGVSFLYQLKGKGTQAISLMQRGEKLSIMGPLGNSFDTTFSGIKTAIVSGGIGIAPLVYLAKGLIKNGNSVDFYCGFKNAPFCTETFDKKATVITSSQEGVADHRGLITEFFDPSAYEKVMTCGPVAMMRIVAQMCKEKGIPCQVSMEQHMACGMGACLVCTCETEHGMKRVCKDGPIFDGNELILND
jgi:dihydroorotate dehydrogenase electron transfer subunit